MSAFETLFGHFERKKSPELQTGQAGLVDSLWAEWPEDSLWPLVFGPVSPGYNNDTASAPSERTVAGQLCYLGRSFERRARDSHGQQGEKRFALGRLNYSLRLRPLCASGEEKRATKWPQVEEKKCLENVQKCSKR